MSGNRQDMQGINEQPPQGGETPTDLNDPGGVKGAAAAFEALDREGMFEDAGSEPTLDVQEERARQQAEPEPFGGQNDLDNAEVEASEEDERGERPEAVERTELDDGQDEPDQELYTIKVQGEERQVPLEELTKGYMFQADYTQKTQQLAQERQAFLEQQQQVNAERQQYQYMLGVLQQQLQEGMGEEPNWTELAQKDPVGYTRARANWEQKQKVLAAANQERQRVAYAQQSEYQRSVQAYNQQQREALINLKPELADVQNANEYRNKLLSYATNHYGLTPQELNTIGDHRAVLILEKAMMFDQAQAKGQQAHQGKTANGGSRVVRPGAAKGGEAVRSRSLRGAKDRLARSGDVRDAASVFESFL